jgi:hypothetical protein
VRQINVNLAVADLLTDGIRCNLQIALVRIMTIDAIWLNADWLRGGRQTRAKCIEVARNAKDIVSRRNMRQTDGAGPSNRNEWPIKAKERARSQVKQARLSG